MRSLALILLALHLSACLQTENSSSYDGARIGNEPHVNILINYCAECHYSEIGFGEGMVDHMVSNGWLTPGDPEGSKVYFRIRESEGPGGPKDMPHGSGPTLEELDILYDWILSLI